MSNKQRLQTNNTNLQSLIDKANALPDAGSSNFETCTVTFPEIMALSETIYYIDGEGTAQEFTRITNEVITITVLKNSIVVSNYAIFGPATYLVENQPVTVLGRPNDNADGYAMIVRGNTILGYSDDAPQ